MNRAIPIEFNRFIDLKHKFRILDCYPTIEIELESSGTSIPKFYRSKSQRRVNGLTIELPESIFIKFKDKDGDDKRLIVAREKNNRIFNAGSHLCESLLTGPRFQKYLELYKAYESLTTSNSRHIEFASLRHSISHASRHLTQKAVLRTLTDLFGELTVNLSKYRHRKMFHIKYWELLIEVDGLMFAEVIAEFPKGREIVKGIRVIK